ncbi:FAD-binding domain-containing protein [Shimia marina]|uniref:Cryptochrome-like protein cry2 n=1 Tax=Shimia marina TaxID=321267 RepID=A0A0P1EJP9_9RHOB|nr:FAD-binding domain-containing protein [Shimia marina]CUH50733.1 Cryptochrome-like protein cry2 [Shimia marina]SFE35568.1 deoxyribodipyrimidine photo-lyase family protein (cryptochrome) [Shimia marina]
MQIVWFKRDLRVQDNAALWQAAQRGPLIPLYVVEPDYWQQPDASARQWDFVAESLAELRQNLHSCGQPLVLRMGDMETVLQDLHNRHGLTDLWSHAETGNDWTYRRDRGVAAWCRDKGITWHELRQNGVQRRLKSRSGWARDWDSFHNTPLCPSPTLKPVSEPLGELPDAKTLQLAPDRCAARQPGGRRAAEERLSSFLTVRGRTYRKAMSSPHTGAYACSRLSPHLAWGTLSMREATQATQRRHLALAAAPARGATQWQGALSSFNARLHWHCHFMQKLEDEPRIEFENMHRAYDGLRPSAPDHDRLSAWRNGETGLPFVDACMRALQATGWLNFRMRAMVMSVASYHLWLPWRDSGLALAQLFTDYEPGIHWSQTQMQSGTTGINTPRIYNPIKQGSDQDPDGRFTRRWVPELRDIPDQHLQTPWKADTAGRVLGKAYPHPIVDPLTAAKAARDKIWAVRRGPGFKQEAAAIVTKHASRKPTRRRAAKAKTTPPQQLKLPF